MERFTASFSGTPLTDFLDDSSPSTSSNIVEKLIRAVFNEKNAPEILLYQADMVKDLQEKVEKQEDLLAEDLDREPAQELRKIVFSLELKRIRYLLRLYFRTRLRKLEATAAHVLGDEEMMERLSPLEQLYTQDFFVLAGTHLKGACLDRLPLDFQSVVKTHEGLADGNDMVLVPPLDAHVFCSVREDVGSIPLEEDNVLDMKANELFIIRYSLVSKLVMSGQAVLV